VSPEKTAEPIEMPFGMWTRLDARKHAVDEDPDRRACEVEILTGKSGQTRTCWAVYILKTTQPGQQWYGADADWVLDGVHIGATWRIRLNRQCAAAMRPYVKLL